MSTNESTATPEPARGRPLSDEVTTAVYAEAMRLVEQTEASTITRRAIATGAGVSRQTLYNRWPTTADILLDALIDRADRSVGSAAGDLRGYLGDLAAAIQGWARPGLRAVIGLAQLDEEVGRRVRVRLLETRHAALIDAIRAELGGAEDGDVGDPGEVDDVAELVAGSMWFRVLVADLPLDDEWVERMVALVRRTRQPPRPTSIE